MGLTAHAYVIRGAMEDVHAVLQLLEKEGINTRANPDIFAWAYSNFSIDDARSLRERAALSPIGKKGRVFVIAAPTIPPDAQNALLKTFEEPPAGAKFFLVVPSPEMLLPTLRSRMQSLELSSRAGSSPVDAAQFLKSTLEKRIEMLKPLLEKDEDDKRDLAGTISFLSELERELAKRPRENELGLRAVYRSRKYITDRGALAKALLEQTALLIPKVL